MVVYFATVAFETEFALSTFRAFLLINNDLSGKRTNPFFWFWRLSLPDGLLTDGVTMT